MRIPIIAAAIAAAGIVSAGGADLPWVFDQSGRSVPAAVEATASMAAVLDVPVVSELESDGTRLSTFPSAMILIVR